MIARFSARADWRIFETLSALGSDIVLTYPQLQLVLIFKVSIAFVCLMSLWCSKEYCGFFFGWFVAYTVCVPRTSLMTRCLACLCHKIIWPGLYSDGTLPRRQSWSVSKDSLAVRERRVLFPFVLRRGKQMSSDHAPSWKKRCKEKCRSRERPCASYIRPISCNYNDIHWGGGGGGSAVYISLAES